MDTSAGKGRLKHSVNTRLLNNLLGSVSSHNRVCEEEEMWQQYGLAKKTNQNIRLTSSEKYSGRGSERRRERSLRSPRPNRPREYDIKRKRMKDADDSDPRSRRETDFGGGRRRRRDFHDDDDDDNDDGNDGDDRRRTDHTAKQHSTFYTRKLYEAESKNPMRWGHDMYKQTYEEEFVSTDDERDHAKTSTSSSSSSRDRKRNSSCFSSASSADDSEREAKRSKKHKKSKSHKNDSTVSKKSKKSSKDKKNEKTKDKKDKKRKKGQRLTMTTLLHLAE